MRQACSYRAHNVAMSVCKEGTPEEFIGSLSQVCKCRTSDEVARVAVGVGEGMDVPFHLLEIVRRAIRIDNDIGLIEWPGTPCGDGYERQLAGGRDEWIAAYPGCRQLAG